MRLAYVVSRYPATSHTFVSREVRELRRLGVSVSTFSVNPPDPPSRLSARDAAESWTTIVLRDRSLAARALLVALRRRPLHLLSVLAEAIRLGNGLRGRVWQVCYLLEALIVWRECERQAITHVHAHFANNGADIARLAARLGGTRWTWSFTMHGPTEFNDQKAFGLAGKSADADLVVCISAFARSQLMAITSADHWDRFSIVRCGLDPVSWEVTRPTPPPGELRVLCTGRLVPEKGQHVLLSAVAACREQGRSVSLVLVGDGPDRASLQVLANQLDLGDCVRFTGAVGVDAVQEEMRSADVFCLPSFQEGVPVVLMEAMAAGLPVVTSRIAGIPELVEDGVSGFLLPPGDLTALTKALGTCMDDVGLRLRMGAAGRDRVSADFNSATEAARLRELFANVLCET